MWRSLPRDIVEQGSPSLVCPNHVVAPYTTRSIARSQAQRESSNREMHCRVQERPFVPGRCNSHMVPLTASRPAMFSLARARGCPYLATSRRNPLNRRWFGFFDPTAQKLICVEPPGRRPSPGLRPTGTLHGLRGKQVVWNPAALAGWLGASLVELAAPATDYVGDKPIEERPVMLILVQLRQRADGT
jgi:hypothetical protein